MALPVYASPLERVWYYTFRIMCALIFLFLVAPILIVMPLSFNVEPYFSFTHKMLALDPSGYRLRWYDTLLTLGVNAPDDAVRDSTWWGMVWEQATWVKAAKNSLWIGYVGDHPRHRAGHHRSTWPVAARDALSPPDHGAADLAR